MFTFERRSGLWARSGASASFWSLPTCCEMKGVGFALVTMLLVAKAAELPPLWSQRRMAEQNFTPAQRPPPEGKCFSQLKTTRFQLQQISSQLEWYINNYGPPSSETSSKISHPHTATDRGDLPLRYFLDPLNQNKIHINERGSLILGG